MSRKDYVLIASALARTRPTNVDDLDLDTDKDGPKRVGYWFQWSVTRDAIIGVLMLDNPAFDRVRFVRATEL